MGVGKGKYVFSPHPKILSASVVTIAPRVHHCSTSMRRFPVQIISPDIEDARNRRRGPSLGTTRSLRVLLFVQHPIPFMLFPLCLILCQLFQLLRIRKTRGRVEGSCSRCSPRWYLMHLPPTPTSTISLPRDYKDFGLYFLLFAASKLL